MIVTRPQVCRIVVCLISTSGAGAAEARDFALVSMVFSLIALTAAARLAKDAVAAKVWDRPVSAALSAVPFVLGLLPIAPRLTSGGVLAVASHVPSLLCLTAAALLCLDFGACLCTGKIEGLASASDSGVLRDRERRLIKTRLTAHKESCVQA